MAVPSSLVQCGQRIALIGIDIVQTGQSFATAGAVADGRFNLLIAFTTRKVTEGDDEKIYQNSDKIAVGEHRQARFSCRIQRIPGV